MKNLEIYCVTNKPIKFLETFNYQLCAVGKNNFSKKYLRCDTGKNIYNKEKHYSELAFHYWYWKNKLDINNENCWAKSLHTYGSIKNKSAKRSQPCGG